MAQIIDANKFTNLRKKIPIVVGIIVAVFVIFAFGFGFFVVIDAGEIGVESLFGKVNKHSLDSGFHLKNPFSKIIKMDAKTQDYTMSAVTGEGERVGDDSIEVLTNEGLSLSLDVTVLYHIEKKEAPKIYKEIGIDYKEKIVRPAIRNTIREVTSQYSAQELYSTKRNEVVKSLNDEMKGKLAERGMAMENVLLRDIKLPAELKAAIEAKQAAEQEAQKMRFVLDKEKQEAERKRIESQGIRDAQEIISQRLTPEYLRWYAIEMLKKISENKNSTYFFCPDG